MELGEAGGYGWQSDKEIFTEDSETYKRPERYQEVSEKERLRAKVRKLKALRNV